MNDDRRRLAQKMGQEFYRSQKEAAVLATGNAGRLQQDDRRIQIAAKNKKKS